MSNENTKDIIGEIYQGSVYFGEIKTTIIAVIATVIALIFVFIGCLIFWNNITLLQDPNAIVDLDTTCTQKTICVTQITYTDMQGVTHSKSFPCMGKYTKGERVTVFYSRSDANDAQIEVPTPFIGSLFLVGAAIILGLGWGFRYLAYNFAPFGAFEGVTGILDIFRWF